MSARDRLLAGLIDYAGLFPPASLDVATAVRNYLRYRAGKRAAVLGRFIIDLARMDAVLETAGEAIQAMRLSVLVPSTAEPDKLIEARESGLPIECIELKSADAAAINSACLWIPPDVECYHEISLAPVSAAILDTLRASGTRAKLRTGGVTPEAFPASNAIVSMLQALIGRHIAFKATAGLHHPVRSEHRLTYAPDSISGAMHGFLNLMAATAVVYHGGSGAEAQRALEEQDTCAFRLLPEEFGWRDWRWDGKQIAAIRQNAFVSFGSCSFEEPIADLEALEWL